MAAPDKVTPDLAGVLSNAGADDLLEVVVELADSDGRDVPADRSERIAYLQTTFHARATPLEEFIASLGGEVLGDAWINQTIHARVPARAVPALARAGSIAAVDMPRRLLPDQPA